MSFLPKYRLVTLALAVMVCAVLFAIVAAIVVPRRVDADAQRKFSDSGGWSTIDSCYPRSSLDIISQTPGFAKEVTLDSLDSGFKHQFETLAKFPRLKILNASEVNEAFDSDRLGKLDRLEVVELTFCSPEFIASIIAASPSLRDIKIWHCPELQDHHLSGIGKCKLMRRINIDVSGLTGAFLREFSLSNELEELTLRESRLDQTGIDAIGNCRSLRVIDIEFSGQPISLRPLHRLTKLESFFIFDFDKNDEDFKQLNLRLKK